MYTAPGSCLSLMNAPFAICLPSTGGVSANSESCRPHTSAFVLHSTVFSCVTQLHSWLHVQEVASRTCTRSTCQI